LSDTLAFGLQNQLFWRILAAHKPEQTVLQAVERVLQREVQHRARLNFSPPRRLTLCDLQGMLDRFVQALFGPEVKTRLRPSYFPFTEPSVEVDVSCFECHGKGCPLCKHSGWIEVLGAGVVHRSVLENCGIDPEVYSGFAFGIGIERIAMLKYGINNIGLMFENDLRFLEQFKG
jgi:phenylalanyl-tRNA synthetase alpha chain